MKMLILLVGVRGSGKSTQLEKLSSHPNLQILKPITTRAPRHADDQEYMFESEESWPSDALEWEILVGDNKYGMLKSELENIAPEGIGITVFHPGNTDRIPQLEGFEIVTIGLDTVLEYEHSMQRVNHGSARDEGINEFSSQKDNVKQCDIVFSGEIETVYQAIDSTLSILRNRGILDSTIIKNLLAAGSLLKDSLTGNTESASYDLRLGDDIWCQGKYLSKDESFIKIPPYSYVIAQAYEKASLPNFVAAHFDIKVSLFIQGVILSNGPQVDPGYTGALFCLLFNGSDRDIGLTRGEHFATIEFCATTNVTPGYAEHYQFEETLEKFMDSTTAVSPGGNIIKRIENIDSKINRHLKYLVPIAITLVLAYLGFTIGLVDLYSKANTKIKELDSEKSKLQLTVDEAKALRDETKKLHQKTTTAYDETKNLHVKTSTLYDEYTSKIDHVLNITNTVQSIVESSINHAKTNGTSGNSGTAVP